MSYKAAFIWKFLERISSQGANFILTIILARLLTPNDYGTVSLVMVLISLATVFVQCGLNTALVQKKTTSDVDYSSSLLISLLIAIVLYYLLCFFAPYIEEFYATPNLSDIIRVFSLMLFPGAINAIQIAKLTRDLKFRVLFKCSSLSTISAAAIGIICAYCGLGAWALVLQQISFQVLSCILMSPHARWKFRLNGGMNSARMMFPFGSRVFLSNIMITLFLNLRSLIIGKLYSSEALGFFNKGNLFPQTIMEGINGTIQTVVLPVFSQQQDNKDTLKHMVRKAVRLSNYLVFPMLVGLACTAIPMVRFLLTDKWLPCAPFIVYFAISFMSHPTQILTAQAMRAIGNSKTPLRLELLRKLMELFLLAITVPISMDAIGISSVICGFFNIAVAMRVNAKVISYTVQEQLSDMMEPLLFSTLMAVVVNLFNGLFTDPCLQLLCQILVGFIAYLVFSIIFRSTCLREFLLFVKKRD